MNITSAFVNTPFAQFASKWATSNVVRFVFECISNLLHFLSYYIFLFLFLRGVLIADTSIVVIVGIVCSIFAAIPDEATANLDPAFQVFPYYEIAISIQAGLFGVQCFLSFVVLLTMGRTMFMIVSLTTEVSNSVKPHGGIYQKFIIYYFLFCNFFKLNI